ncbi:MAG: DUF1295 domain-containing protein [Anaerolineales bacterium]|nr:DUF1295 domain-containing protein [Anaerolineales bacterium]
MLTSVTTLLIVTFTAVALAWAGSQEGMTLNEIPVFALAIGLAFVINLLAFVPAFLLQTEIFFDLTGSLTFLVVLAFVVLAVWRLAPPDARAWLSVALTITWAIRLGVFLTLRIRRTGKDARFDELKRSLLRFLLTWMMQALWVSFTLAPVLVMLTTQNRKPFDGFALLGLLLWVVGFLIEVVADVQKIRFCADPSNQGKFIQTGLWSRSRHPNYFGEILLWLGMTTIALPVLQGWQWVVALTPLFVALLLIRISGVPLLERRAEERWGALLEYQEYKRRTPLLIPRLW